MTESFGRYRIEKELGRGAMGIVYHAMDTVLERHVAIKTISSGLRDEHVKERFIREAKAAGKLQHPNIVTIYDFGVHENQLFISMEFVEGSDLFELIHSRPPLDIKTKLEIVRQICLGLDYAHKQGVFHRDIKPANIRLTTDYKVKVVDFGLAVIQTSSLTKSNAILGTPTYIAPERLMGKPADSRSDQFAVGVILFEMMTYCQAFQGDNISILINNILNSEPPNLEDKSISQYPELNAIFKKSVAKKPGHRYPTMKEMAEDIEKLKHKMAMNQFAATEPIPVGGNSYFTTQIDKPTEDFSLEESGPTPVDAPDSTPAPPDSLPEISKPSPMKWAVLGVVGLVVAVALYFLLFQKKAPVLEPGFLVVDMKPYAHILKIEDLKTGESIPLGKTEAEKTTPFRLSLAPGEYKVVYDHPDLQGEARTKKLTITEGGLVVQEDFLDKQFIEEAVKYFALSYDLIKDEK